MNQFEKAKPAKNEYTSMSEEAKVGLADETVAFVSIEQKDGVKR